MDVGRKSKKGRVHSSTISWKDLNRLVGPWQEGNLGKDKFLSSDIIDTLLQVMSRDNQQGRTLHTMAMIWAADPILDKGVQVYRNQSQGGRQMGRPQETCQTRGKLGFPGDTNKLRNH